MMQAEMAELMREHGFHFGDLQPLQQRVEEHDAACCARLR
jgi:hypothetical protein